MDTTEISKTMTAITDKAEAESRSLTVAEMDEYERLEGELATEQRREQIRSRDRAYRTPAAAPAVATARDEQDEAEQNRAFEAYLRTGQVNGDLVQYRAQSEGSDAAGGYLVPDSFLTQIVERQKQFGGIAPFATQMPTAKGEHTTWPSLDDTANSGAIATENAAVGSGGADVVFGQVAIDAYTYVSTGTGNAPVKVSVELLQDSDFDVQPMLARILGTRLARAQAPDWTLGSGTGEPDGICRSGLTADVNQGTSGTFTYAELCSVEDAVDPAYLQNARWAMNSKMWSKIRQLVDTAGRPLITEAAAAGIGAAVNRQLLGYPVVIDQSLPDAADNTNFAILGDIAEAYVIRRVGSIVMWVNPYASSRYVQFEASERADGTVQNRNAYAVLAGKVV